MRCAAFGLAGVLALAMVTSPAAYAQEPVPAPLPRALPKIVDTGEIITETGARYESLTTPPLAKSSSNRQEATK